ncbi:hypothetical protein A8B98_02770 [Hymenobacter sp. UV11]|nr:hypothetical protein A8B98_02770 [Hymenobacter sp. UV11]
MNDVVDVSIIHRLIGTSRIVRHAFKLHSYWPLAIAFLAMTMLAEACEERLTFFNISLGIGVRITKHTLCNSYTILWNMVEISNLTSRYSTECWRTLIDSKRVNLVIGYLT